MRAACGVFGIGKSGGKQVVFKRLLEHSKRGHGRMALEIALKNREDGLRIADGGPALPQAPDAATCEKYRLTRLPFKPWCEACVATRSRDMFANTSVGQRDSEMMKHLVGVDSWMLWHCCVLLYAWERWNLSQKMHCSS